VTYREFLRRQLLRTYRSYQTATDETLTFDDLIFLGALTSACLADLLPDWKTTVLRRGTWLEETMMECHSVGG
jgi:hypothetical protein